MRNDIPGIVLAWFSLAAASVATASWLGYGTWSQEQDLQADISALDSLQSRVMRESLPKTLEVLDIEVVSNAWDKQIQRLGSGTAAFESAKVMESNPLEGSDLIAHTIVIRLRAISLVDLKELLEQPFSASIAGVAVSSPDLPIGAGPELWDVRLTLTQICLPG